MTVVAHIKKSAPQGTAKKQQIKERGCELNRKGVPPNYIVINLNDLNSSDPGSVGDFIFASDANGDKAPWDKSWVVAIELTCGTKTATRVKNQLNAAAKVAEQLTNNINKNVEFKFIPVFVYGGRVDIQKMKQVKIKFRGETRGVTVVRCESPLYKALLARGSGG